MFKLIILLAVFLTNCVYQPTETETDDLSFVGTWEFKATSFEGVSTKIVYTLTEFYEVRKDLIASKDILLLKWQIQEGTYFVEDEKLLSEYTLCKESDGAGLIRRDCPNIDESIKVSLDGRTAIINGLEFIKVLDVE